MFGQYITFVIYFSILQHLTLILKIQIFSSSSLQRLRHINNKAVISIARKKKVM